ncbi:pituitary tumor-transforming gene 1 protein-interacting protein-like [Takifugu flavidus]|uniref:pituitary tumor-transforming gene 1 protein-interacting protein-like n=1 Tax=Takifugu flavidus TaxID=433684 RepID=UPI0025448DA8|nr:pituitary tumor-transforming gene 1 protein-interacting protein-like [Takifugu flavidus]
MGCLKADGLSLQTVFIIAVLLVGLGQSQTLSPPPTPCSAFTSCDDCLQYTRCFWCFSTNNCTYYPVSWLIPPSSLCPLSQARWGMCWINFEALVITLGVVAGIIVLAVTICCCYCCCCCMRRRSRRLRRIPFNDTKGLKRDGDHLYSRFENE